MKNHSSEILGFTLILILIRCLSNNSPYLITIIAILNFFALFIVFHSIVQQVIPRLFLEIEKHGISELIINREKKSVKTKIYFGTTILFIGLIAINIFCGITELSNDIISIASIGLSLIDSSIVDFISKNFKIWGVIMNTVVELIKDFFSENEWNYSYNEDKSIIKSELSMNNAIGDLNIYIRIRETDYTVYTVLNSYVEKDFMNQVSEYLHRANYGLISGNFELCYEDGEVRFKTFVNFTNIELSKDIVAESIVVPIFMFEKYGINLLKLMISKNDPKVLIEEVESNAEEDT